MFISHTQEIIILSTTRELTIDATVDNLHRVQAFIDEDLDAAGCPAAAHMQLEVAVEEIFVNIASYAYEGQTGKARIIITREEDPARVMISFCDSGKPFDPLAKPDPDVTLPAEERQIGGLGIFMVKKSMDDMSYEYSNGENILTITKSL